MLFRNHQQRQNRYRLQGPPRFNTPPYRMNRYMPMQQGRTPAGGRGIQHLLGRIFGNGGQMTNVARQTGSESGGGLVKTLANIQQILNVVQSTAPVIQEYGPMIKNLPAMYRMMKAFKELEKMDDDKNDDEKEIKEEETSPPTLYLAEDKSNEEEYENKIDNKNPEEFGKSTPKLYI